MRAVIFDMDGVIIDSEPYWQRAEVEVFRSVGVPLTGEMCKQTTGLRMNDMVDHWYQRHPWSGPSRDDIARQVVSRVAELITMHAGPIEGAIELVEDLRAAGVPLGLCSSSPRTLMDCVCKTLGLRTHFSLLQSAEECTHGKPHPEPYLVTAAGMGQSPANCIAIEDSTNGMRSAKAAGMRVIGFTRDHSPQVAALCDLVCPRLSSLTAKVVLNIEA
jgi:sugar-phosphatase